MTQWARRIESTLEEHNLGCHFGVFGVKLHPGLMSYAPHSAATWGWRDGCTGQP
ncbi:protein of unknown function [Pararobbsia alpina]